MSEHYGSEYVKDYQKCINCGCFRPERELTSAACTDRVLCKSLGEQRLEAARLFALHREQLNGKAVAGVEELGKGSRQAAPGKASPPGK